jgi:hypothetical protein
LQAYTEPKTINEIMNANDFVEAKTLRCDLGSICGSNLFIIQVNVLHHLACIELTVETIESDLDGQVYIDYNLYLIGERLTLKYF